MRSLGVLVIVLALAYFSFAGETEVNRYLIKDDRGADYEQHINTLVENEEAGITQHNETIYVHIVPHSHDDVGFRKTLDQYFSGSHDMIIRSGVQYIIHEVIQELEADPAKRFTYAEMAFFMRWWRNQNDTIKDTVKKLVKEGRFEFINGGWSMNDEATTHYEDIITNLQKGHKFLLEEFGVTPTVGWHIDPFGHSSAQAALFSRMGFESLYMCRIDYRDKIKRRIEKNMEFVWTPFFEDRQTKDSIFTHVMYDMYWGLPNFYFDDMRAEDPIVEGYNMKEMFRQFASWVYKYHDVYKTNHIFIPMGGDFNFENAHNTFMSIDRLVQNFNKTYHGIQVFYSTPGKYMKAVIESKGVEWPTNKDDFFPYADDQESYWTGFYSSRTNQKGYIRQASRQFMAANQFMALETIQSSFSQTNFDQQDVLAAGLSIAQHHDAATGTSKQAVADDYIDYLYSGIKLSEKAQISAIKHLYNSTLDYTFCDVTNSTYYECKITESLKNKNKVILTVLNPSAIQRTNELIRIKVPPVNISVLDLSSDSQIQSDLICNDKFTYEGYVEDCDLYFTLSSINPLSTRSFLLSQVPRDQFDDNKKTNSSDSNAFKWSFKYEGDSVMKVSFSRRYQSDQLNFTYAYKYYKSYEKEGQKSGLYILRDEESGAAAQIYGAITNHTEFVGSCVAVFTTKGDEVDSQVIIPLHADVLYAHITTRLKGIKGPHGKEIVLEVGGLKNSSDRFYTDSNGMVMEERILNQRKHFSLTNLTGFEVVSNFYPVNSAITIRDNSTSSIDRDQLTVLNDRAQAGASLNSSSVQLLIARRTFFDDNRGVDEPLNETISDGRSRIYEVNHFVVHSKISELKKNDYMETKRLQRSLLEEPLQTIFAYNTKSNLYELKHLTKKEKFKSLEYISSLPASIKIVTKPIESKKCSFEGEDQNCEETDKVMIRIYNMNEKFDGFNSTIKVDLFGIIADLIELREQTNQNISLRISEWNLSLNKQIKEMNTVFDVV